MTREDKLFWGIALALLLCLLAGMVKAGIVPKPPKIYRHATVTQGQGAGDLVASNAKPSLPRTVEVGWTYQETPYHWRSNMMFYVYRRASATGPWRCVAATSGDSYSEIQDGADMVWYGVIASNTVTEQVSGELTCE